MPINQFSNVMYSWAPAGTSKANTFTAQNIFKAATTTDPAAIFQATGTISAIPTMDANAIAMFQGTEGTTSHVFFSSAASNAHFVFRRRQGTYASPTAIQSGNVLGAFQWQGYGVSTFGSVAAAEIRGVARQAFTESARGTALEFYVTANGSTANTQIFVMESALVYATTALQGFASVRASASAGNVRDFRLTTSTVQRWSLIANATAEGGSNAGSDFEIRRYSDAGADLGAVVSINRANGGTIFANNVTFSTQASVDGASGTNRLLLWRTSGSNRWAIYADSGAETGTGNAGSSFAISRYTDAGGYIDNPIVISRSTGKVTFAGNAINIATTQSPPSGTSGTTGDLAWDDTYLYGRTSTGWKRIAWVAY